MFEALGKAILEARLEYHSTWLDVNKMLNDAGIITDEQHEESNKRHVMIIFNDIFPKMFPNLFIKNWKK